MNVNGQHKILYAGVLVMSFFLVLAALGGGLFAQSGSWMNHWQHTAFSGLCHQDPSRSLWINGIPAAVCSRCLGIYTGFAVSWLTIPAAFAIGDRIMNSNIINIAFGYAGYILLLAILANVADVIGNGIGMWENTLAFRFVLGFTVGSGAVMLIGTAFLQQQSNRGISYGTDERV